MRPIILLSSSFGIDPLLRVAQLTNRDVIGILDDNFFGNTDSICSVPVIGSENSWNFDKTRNDFDFFIGASMVPMNVNDREKRHKMIDIVDRYKLNLATLIHPFSEIYDDVQIGQGSYIGYCASINNRVAVGRHCQIHSLVGVSHDCQIGDNTCLGHRVMVAGYNNIGSHVHVGMGSSIAKNGVTIGDHSVIHPGITVMRSVDDREIVHLGGDNTRRIYGEVVRS
jgi:UDP-3-O-[3-hydroxymyristoyl] glucosamine N-acyltransferase